MRRLRWGIAAAAVLATAAPARADDAAAREAQARFEEGLARVRSSDLEGALLSFRQANAVIHKPAVVWNLALTEEKTKRPVDALAHFREYLRLATPTDPDRPRAQKHIDALAAATGHIEVAAPAGAAVSVDGTVAPGATPFADPIDVTPGHHDVEARLGTMVKTLGVEAVAGQTTRADFAGLDAKPTPGATAPQSTGEAPVAPPEAPVAPPDQGATTYVSPTARLVTVIALGSGALAAGGTALAFGIASSNEAGTAAALRSTVPTCEGVTSAQCQQLASDTSAQHTDHVISTAMWAIGGTLAVASVGAFFLWPREKAAVTVVPAVGPGTAGVVVGGGF